MKKALSLILALILTLSIGTVAFAADPTTPISKAAATDAALEYLSFKDSSSVVRTDTYLHPYDGEIPVYNVVSTIILNSGRTLILSSLVDMYTGDVYGHSASFLGLEAMLTRNITQQEAYELAIEAFGVDTSNIYVLEKKQVITDNGDVASHFIFCEGYFERHECTVLARNGYIDDITIGEPSNIIDRLLLLFKILIAKFNLLERLDRLENLGGIGGLLPKL